MSSPELSIASDGIAEIVFDAPDRSVNVLTNDVMARLSLHLDELHAASATGAVRGILVRSAKPASFIVGADIEAIAGIEDPVAGAEAARLGQAVYHKLATLPVPTLCAIHGACMGGGTELALACRLRVASDSDRTRIGLPEVQLGILPAWGGTTRLPKLIGLKGALDLLLTGRSVSGSSAKRRGLVDEVLPSEEFPDRARAYFAEQIDRVGESAPSRKGLGDRLLEATPVGRRVVLRMARRNVLEKTGGHYPAPLRILDVVQDSWGRPEDEALEHEARALGDLIPSDVSKNLVHVFQLRESAKKLGRALGENAASVDDLGVVGAGTMGGGIAQLAALHGIRVRVKDIRQEAVTLALQHAAELFDKAVEKRKATRRDVDQAMDRISGGLEYVGFGPVDLVIEAVLERMDVKQQVFREVEAVVSDTCVLATNTSSLSVDEMAEALRRPERLVGMHFFNPVHRMPLVEVVRGRRTDDRSAATIHALALRLGKVPIIVSDGPGFLVNRILGPYLNEAGFLLEDGASIEAIDGALTSFGMPMGPLRLMDEVGIDIVRHAGETLYGALGERLAPSPPVVALGDSDRLGRKGGAGFYRYENGKEAGVDPGVYAACGIEPGRDDALAEDLIRDRLVLAMLNEAARALSDGIAASAGDVDLGMIMGTGFPPFRGGLLRYADRRHLRAVADRLTELARAHGPRFEPAPLLLELAREDRTFYAAFPGPR